MKLGGYIFAFVIAALVVSVVMTTVSAIQKKQDATLEERKEKEQSNWIMISVEGVDCVVKLNSYDDVAASCNWDAFNEKESE